MKIIKILAVISVMLMAIGSKASVKQIKCHTPRENHIFTIKNDRLVLEGRNLASTVAQRMRKTATGFTTYFSFQGKKHKLHIDNTNSFSELDDYIQMRSKQGHEMTYPLTCSWK
ncbi:hypothetical protein HBN50_00165 [Halobacteriovorax sp. GB3]|uniref:hypothetical protein n=1 Tax=Halobacteriovorax sp. GB3 TaxID=2719615 RepID=UPI00235F12B4|nr:hypothetical protein [Halobacteriovorax sp. GB3]MDD0851480.1 hypothetical protein [Halobacteriovorax sp. GB3]